ncbi:amidohydrolase family protein [Williamsia sterculiae]|uniref:6-methylsalicylate decarboxylase n=1 Tax=Williamsia sterculiae TaxID=1344003 RepID=A0A1N7FKZ8_9NOCA|nr:amidohydrolase family protein [Williamsia sterculiae]SIS00937.1 Predicted metal-dependent hydrolase, TIM-barrel fold [Williamsia sterculiae]
MSPDADHQLVDVHAHFLTDEYVAAATGAGISRPDGMPGWPDWSLDTHVADMDRRDVGFALLSISSPGVHFGDDDAAADLARLVNDIASHHCRSHPQRLGFLASIPLPDVDAAVSEADRALGLSGALGVIVESNAHGQYLGDQALEPLWAAIEARDALVLIHPTSPPAADQTGLGRPRPMLEFMFDSTRSVADLVLSGVLTRHPGLRVIVPHSGAVLPALHDRISLFLDGFAAPGPTGDDWRDAMGRLWFDTAGTPFPRALRHLVEIVGERHILYGSDSCWTPSPLVDDHLVQMRTHTGPSGRSWVDVTAANARRLLRNEAERGLPPRL